MIHLHVTEHSLVDLPATSSNAYTQYANIQIEDNVNLTVNDDCNFVPDILSFIFFDSINTINLDIL